MKYRNKIVIVGVLCIPLLSCSLFGPKEENISLNIQGTVTDRADQSPLESVEVTLRRNGWDWLTWDYTDKDGKYTLDWEGNLDCDSDSLSVFAVTPQSEYGNAERAINCASGNLTVNFEFMKH
jgi:predicted transcriptional regulator